MCSPRLRGSTMPMPLHLLKFRGQDWTASSLVWTASRLQCDPDVCQDRDFWNCICSVPLERKHVHFSNMRYETVICACEEVVRPRTNPCTSRVLVLFQKSSTSRSTGHINQAAQCTTRHAATNQGSCIGYSPAMSHRTHQTVPLSPPRCDSLALS